MSGGSSKTTINFEDTSQYIFRNSSRNRGYFEGEAGYVSTSDDRTSNTTLLTDTELDRLNTQIDTMATLGIDGLVADKPELVDRADAAWDRAIALYPAFKALTEDRLADLKAEMLAQIQLMTNQWARTAGSSLNCLVQKMQTDAETEMARRMAAVISSDYKDMVVHETQAMASAFEAELKARAGVDETAINSVATLTNILRGSKAKEVDERDIHELRVMGKFGHEAEDWSDNNGTYSGEVSNLSSAATAISGAAGGVI